MSTATSAVSSQRYCERRPRPELAGILSCVWIQEVSAEGPAYEHRTVPNGCSEIACVLDTGIVRVAGTRRGPALARHSPGARIVGVRFRPGVAPGILGLPASHVVDVDLELDRLWGRPANTLGARLAEAASAEDAADMLEDDMIGKCAAAPPLDPLVAEAVTRLQPWRHSDVNEATSELFISRRQLRRRFAAALGFGPKTLQRILRFQGFLALLNAHHGDDVTLSRLASAAGYADQAHLNRECSRLTGLTPTRFLDEMRTSCGPTHDHAASFAPLRQALLRASPAMAS